jgi:hypothetical protein
MKQVDYSFLEYTYNPEQLPTNIIEQRLKKLGFTKRTRNTQGNVAIYTQNLCILLLKTALVQDAGLSGIGFICDKDVINNTNAQLDPDDTGMYIVDNYAGLRTLLMPEQDFSDLRKSLQHIEKTTTSDEGGLTYVSGISVY